ncbi:MAG TPA: T9SS type A sorting domain-containing protein [Ignavibacteria bacterium]
MKTQILFLFLFITVVSFSQSSYDNNYNLSFDDTSVFFKIQKDTIHHLHNIWQIGKPNKQIFLNAYSAPNVIVTDTVNAYPINDTSVFVIKNISDCLGGFQWPHTVILSGKYYVNSDTLNDYGTIEFSPDNGNTWINLITDTIYSMYHLYEWNTQKPVLTGNSNGWVDFYVWVAGFGPFFNIQPGDTVQYRFSFISDSIQTNKDGLMYDNFHFEDWAEFIEKHMVDEIELKLYPNPTNAYFTIEIFNNVNSNYNFDLYDQDGQIVLRKEFHQVNITIDIKSLKNGIYVYKLIDLESDCTSYGKIIKE